MYDTKKFRIKRFYSSLIVAVLFLVVLRHRSISVRALRLVYVLDQVMLDSYKFLNSLNELKVSRPLPLSKKLLINWRDTKNLVYQSRLYFFLYF